jgi:hypothetical protein
MDANKVKEIIIGYEKERDSLVVKLNTKLEEAKILQNKIQFLNGEISGTIKLSNLLIQESKTKEEPETDNEEPKVEPENNTE